MSLLKSFFEYHDKGVVEKEHGFFTYTIVNEEEFLISDMFMEESKRGRGEGLSLAREAEAMAREKGCKFLSCNIWPKEHTIAHTNWLLLAYMRFGFSLVSVKDGALIMVKGLGK